MQLFRRWIPSSVKFGLPIFIIIVFKIMFIIFKKLDAIASDNFSCPPGTSLEKGLISPSR
jgi:hypothetical protein